MAEFIARVLMVAIQWYINQQHAMQRAAGPMAWQALLDLRSMINGPE